MTLPPLHTHLICFWLILSLSNFGGQSHSSHCSSPSLKTICFTNERAVTAEKAHLDATKCWNKCRAALQWLTDVITSHVMTRQINVYLCLWETERFCVSACFFFWMSVNKRVCVSLCMEDLALSVSKAADWFTWLSICLWYMSTSLWQIISFFNSLDNPV